MTKLEYVPRGIDDVLEYYGRPGNIENDKFITDREWVADNLVWYGMSFPLRQSWDYKQIRGFYIHHKVGPAMIDALEEVHAIYGLGFMQLHGLDYWGGCHNPRFKRRSKEPSTHAWAISIDYCPGLGKLGDPTRMPWHIVEVFVKRGFDWGGFWLTPDGMHFQACLGY